MVIVSMVTEQLVPLLLSFPQGLDKFVVEDDQGDEGHEEHHQKIQHVRVDDLVVDVLPQGRGP